MVVGSAEVVDSADETGGSLGTVAGDERVAKGVGRGRSFREFALWAMVLDSMIGRIDARWGPLEVLQRMEVGICPPQRLDYQC